MKRRGFLGLMLSAPIVAKANLSCLPVLLKDTPPVVMKNLARTEYRNGTWHVYDAAGHLRVRMGVF
jgi:hypothetical protein